MPLEAATIDRTKSRSAPRGGAHDHRAPRALRSEEPLQIGRVEHYIRAHLVEPISLAILVKIARVGARALQASFRAHRGTTPMRFLRDCRLDLARARLLTSRGDETVMQIAVECGFEHVGRFTVAYRARFGEMPRHALARRR